MNTFEPAGYPTVSPYLIVNGADSTIRFLVAAFDATELRRAADASGKVMRT